MVSSLVDSSEKKVNPETSIGLLGKHQFGLIEVSVLGEMLKEQMEEKHKRKQGAVDETFRKEETCVIQPLT